jgi:hypothetical protein
MGGRPERKMREKILGEKEGERETVGGNVVLFGFIPPSVVSECINKEKKALEEVRKVL